METILQFEPEPGFELELKREKVWGSGKEEERRDRYMEAKKQKR